MPLETTDQILDQSTVERLSAGFHRCFSHFEATDGLFADATFFDLLPPMWRFQIEGSGDDFVAQLRAIATGPVDIDIVRSVPAAGGFVTEHVETMHAPDGDLVARRIHLCQVTDGRISAVTTYCNGGWDEELRDRHAAEAPMLRA